MKKTLLLLLFISTITFAHAQIGIPEIRNFSSLLYKGGAQTWQIDQDRKGILYFANNDGLLTYDGTYWKLYPLPHKTIVRSVKVANDGKVFVGGQDEIGYFYPNQNGVLTYFPLEDRLPPSDRKLDDVWDIVIQKDQVYFRGASKILRFKDGVFNVYKSKSIWSFLGLADGTIYAQDAERGLLAFKNNAWDVIGTTNDFNGASVTSVLAYQGKKNLITTDKNGLYLIENNNVVPFNTSNNAFFKQNRIYEAVAVNRSWYAFATATSGCVIVDKNGTIVQHFTSAAGLQKNNVRYVFKDKDQNLWLGLDDGIDFIAFNNAIKYIYPDKNKLTSGYTSQILDNTLYIGTSSGLFASPLDGKHSDLSFNSNAFTEIPNTEGQIWNINSINKKMVIAHEDGAFEINNGLAKRLYKSPGTWMFQALSSYSPAEELVAGTYSGLLFLKYNNHRFEIQKEVMGINESLRFIIYDANYNDVWASHPYRGVYKFKLNSNKSRVQKIFIYNRKHGLPSTLSNYIAQIKNRIVVATLRGIYEFNEKKQQFEPSKLFAPIFGEMVIQYLKEDQYGNVWFVSNKRVGVVDFARKSKGKGFSLIYFPELTSKVVAGFENIYPYNQQNIFLAANKGLIHINYEHYLKSPHQLKAHISSVKMLGKKDSILFGGFFMNNGKPASVQGENSIPQISNKYNSLQFYYTSALYGQQSNLEYSYRLDGFEQEWSAWASKTEKEYTNLPHGNYIFKVRVRNNLGNESAAVCYGFYIKPAWYQTWWFYGFCVVITGFMIYLLVHYQKRKHQRKEANLKKEYLREIELSEKEIVKLRNEKLETEVDFKNKELGTTTMHLMQRGKLLTRIKQELVPIIKKNDPNNIPEEFKKIWSLISDEESGDNDWEHFAIHFDHVHHNFLAILKEKVPLLSSNDLKLCAFLKMNLSSKEIAQLMNITIRAVETSRYRLRKKLGVSSDTNLFNYLINITNGH